MRLLTIRGGHAPSSDIPCVECRRKAKRFIHVRMDTQSGRPGLGGLYCLDCGRKFEEEMKHAFQEAEAQ